MNTTSHNAHHSIHSNYKILGMTCNGCVKTVTNKILQIPDVISVDINLENKNVDISAHRNISVAEVRKIFTDLPKYTVEGEETPEPAPAPEKTFFETYKPLFIVFGFIFIVSLAYQSTLERFHIHVFMNHIMAGFFIGLSFFKFLDLQSFSESFSSYDPIAQRWLTYGYVYPFIELSLGLMFVAGVGLVFANVATIIILSITTYGVYKRLQSKTKIQCACLGTAFSFPLSNITIAENLAMILMAGYGLVSFL